MLGQLQQILMHLAQKLQLPQLVEHRPMEEQPFLYKTTSGRFINFNSFNHFFLISPYYTSLYKYPYFLYLVCQALVA